MGLIILFILLVSGYGVFKLNQWNKRALDIYYQYKDPNQPESVSNTTIIITKNSGD